MVVDCAVVARDLSDLWADHGAMLARIASGQPERDDVLTLVCLATDAQMLAVTVARAVAPDALTHAYITLG